MVKQGKKKSLGQGKYYDLKAALQKLMECPSFLPLCNLWLKYRTSNDIMVDITDGNIWKLLMSSMSLDKEPTNSLEELLNIIGFNHTRISPILLVLFTQS